MIMGQTLVQIFRSSIIMVLLLVASIAALALIIERFWYFMRNRFDPGKGLRELRRLLESGGQSEALTWARSQKNPLGRLFTLALLNFTLPADELTDLLYSLILEERIRFERLLGGMGTLANAATLLGLLGTVTGLIRAFHNIAVTGSGGPAVVSAGIAEALLTTAFGLMIGIPTLFFYNYYSKKAADLTLILEGTADRLVVALERHRRNEPAQAAPAEPASRSKPQASPAKDTSWEF